MRTQIQQALRLLKGQYLLYYRELTPPDFSGLPEGWQQHYETQIHPRLVYFERERIHALERYQKYLMFGVPLAVVLVAAGTVTSLMAWEKGNFIASLFAAWGIFYFCSSPVRKYKGDLKQQIFPLIFRMFGNDFTFAHKTSFSVEELKPSGIIPYYNNQKNEDEVRGSYKGVKIRLVESKLEAGSGKNRHTVFRGIYISLDMNKPFHGRTVILKNRKSMEIFSKRKHENMERVELEDPVFNACFEVYGTDQVEARYLLTTAFMERLLALCKLPEIHDLEASFYERRLLLAIPYNNCFEIQDIFEPANCQQEIATIYREMQEIFRIIDVLKLSHDIGM